MRTSSFAIALLLCTAPAARGQEPICIIDGVRVAASVCTAQGALDPRRIESIEVLKGQAASVYAPDAREGVIVITTRGGVGFTAPSVEDPLARSLFPPEFVMANQQAINLTDRQRSAIQGAMREAQSRFVDLQFSVSGEMEKLKRLIEATTVDEAAVLAQVDRVLAAEREVKRAQLALLVRIKNQLTEEQQTALRMLRR